MDVSKAHKRVRVAQLHDLIENMRARTPITAQSQKHKIVEVISGGDQSSFDKDRPERSCNP